MMVQPTHFANLHDVAFCGRLNSSRLRSVLAEREVSAPGMVVRCIGGERAMQGTVAEDDHMVHTLTTNGPDEPFNIRALPGRTWRRQYLFDAHCLHLLNELMAEDAISVAQHIARRFVPWKGFPKLLGGPLGARMCRDREMHDAPAVVCQHQK